jgi:hypothetical protein
MNAFTYKDLTQRSGARRTSRLHRAPLAAALLALCVLFCLFGAAASAGAATPGKAIVKSPRGTITTTKPTFKWSKDAGATKYELRVYKGSKLLLKKTGLKKLSWKSSKALPKNVSLTWKVRGSNARGAGAWSKSLTFKIVSPYAPQGTITTPTPTFKWSKVAGVTKYEVRIYQGSKLLLKKTGLKKLSWKSSKALPMHVGLTWKVRGSKGRHTSAWKIFKFTIVPPATQIALNAGNAQIG